MGLWWRTRALALLALFLAVALPVVARLAAPDSPLASPLAGLLWAAAALAGAGLALSIAESRSEAALRAVRKLTAARTLPLDLRAFLELALEQALSIAGGEAGVALLADPAGRLSVQTGVNLDLCYSAQAEPLSLGSAAGSRLAKLMEPEALDPALLGPVAAGILGKVPVRGAVAAPLRAGDRTWGCLIIVRARPVRLSSEEASALATLGACAGTALSDDRAYNELLREARTDPLTGLASRRHFNEAFRRELAVGRRHARSISLAMLDVDHLKRINDEHGHLMGDQVLVALARLLRGMRAGDLPARYGGDEFLVLMPDTTQPQAERVLERLQQRIDEFNLEGHFPFPLRISAGVREMNGRLDLDLIAAADEAMYLEKRKSRGGGAVSRTELHVETAQSAVYSDRCYSGAKGGECAGPGADTEGPPPG